MIDYVWSANRVRWSLVRASQQRDQRGGYQITPIGRGRSMVHYELDITPSIPIPGFLLRQVMKKAVHAATAGLKQRVESLEYPQDAHSGATTAARTRPRRARGST